MWCVRIGVVRWPGWRWGRVSDGVMAYDLYRFSRKVIEGERRITAAEGGARVWALAGEYRLMTADGRAAFREAR